MLEKSWLGWKIFYHQRRRVTKSNQEPDSATTPSSQVLDYEEFTNPLTQEQNAGEELARVEDLLSSEEVSIPEPDSAAAPSSQFDPALLLLWAAGLACENRLGLD